VKNSYIVVTIGNTQLAVSDCAELRQRKIRSLITVQSVQATFGQLSQHIYRSTAWDDEQKWNAIETYLKRLFPKSTEPDEVFFRIHPSPIPWRYGTVNKLEDFFSSLGWKKL
jgi:hypothetical protein